MPYAIEIKDNKVVVYEQYIYAETTLDKMTDYLIKRVPTVTPRLPADTRFFAYDPDAKLLTLIIEKPPRKVRLTFDQQSTDPGFMSNGDEWIAEGVPLVLPYQLWHVEMSNIDSDSASIDSTRLYFRSEPLDDPNNNFVLPAGPIPNVFNDGEVCWGDTVPNIDNGIARLEALIENFWETRFNDDVEINFIGWPFSSYTDWISVLEDRPDYWVNFQQQAWGNTYLRTYWTRHDPPVLTQQATLTLNDTQNATTGRIVEMLRTADPGWVRRLTRAIRAIEQNPTAPTEELVNA